jgi:hypothetical protein
MWRHNVKSGWGILSQQISIVVCDDEGVGCINGFPATYNQLSYIEQCSYSSAMWYTRFRNEPASLLQTPWYGATSFTNGLYYSSKKKALHWMFWFVDSLSYIYVGICPISEMSVGLSISMILTRNDPPGLDWQVSGVCKCRWKKRTLSFLKY